MNKKQYIAPSLEEYRIETHGMLAASKFDATSDNPIITPTDESFDGEFSAPGLLF